MRLLPCFLSAILATAILSCSDDNRNSVFVPVSTTPSGSNQNSTRFELLAPNQCGIDFKPEITDEHRYNFIADPYIYNGGGVAVLDVNNDGLQDLFFTNRLQGCRLYLNEGNLHFNDISESSGVGSFSGLKTGVVAVDVNTDGWMDLYVCRTWLSPVPERKNILLVNNRNGTFTDKAAEARLDDISASQHANFFDYDQDGDLDCYVLNHPVDFKTINNLDHQGNDARKDLPRNEFESDRLLRNDKGVFTDVTNMAGLANRAFGLSTLASDFNGDGWTDLFVGNDFVMPDFLYINNQDGTFSDQADRYFRHTSNHTMGADYADLNNDGFSDLITLDMLAEPLDRRLRLMNTMQRTRDTQMRAKGYGRQVMRNTLQINNGNNGFSEAACLTGMFATDWSWAPLVADLDNDGYKDVFISNGIQRDLNDTDFFVFTADSINRSGGISKSRFPDFNEFVKMMPSVPVSNYVFRNTGNMEFVQVSSDWGFTEKGFSNGAVYADLDNDGDLEIVTNTLQSPPHIYENKATNLNSNHWLQIKLRGTAENPMGIGAVVRVFDRNEKGESVILFAQEMTNVRGFYSSVEPIFQIGAGSRTSIEKVEVSWGKYSQTLYNVPTNQRITLNRADATPAKLPAMGIQRVFADITTESGISYTHRENDFEDFDREKLIPWRLSRRGPCLSAADINGDRLSDLFIGGAAGQAGTVFIQQPGGKFREMPQPVFEKDKACEDTGSVFFDADGDGDSDLFVASGGNEAPGSSAVYQDRLYLNDGKGLFTSAVGAIPVENNPGTCVAAADLNQDGRPELIIGGGCEPGKYPRSTYTRLLYNDGGTFRLATELIPGLAEAGLVTDIRVADINGDALPEIIVAGEWMAIRVFGQQKGAYSDMTVQYGLGNSTGLWRSVETADLDQDGDMDIMAGNIGLNTRYKASVGAPLRLFATDLDKNGSTDPIIAQADGGRYRPAAQREMLAAQVPSVRKRFPRNTPYATAAIEEIFPEEDLLGGLILQAQILASGWFENKNGIFEFHALPYPAQLAPVERMIAGQFNRDDITDLIVLGNDYGMDTETYQLDASEGYVLFGGGRGNFTTHGQIGANGEARDACLLDGKMLVVVRSGGVASVFVPGGG
jgi:hypothetical protein